MSIKQAIEALEELVEYAEEAGFDWSLDNARAALAALRSMPAEPVGEKQAILDGLYAAWNREPAGDTLAAIGNAIQHLQATPHTEAVRMSEAEIEDLFQQAADADEEVHIRFARAVEQATAARLGVKMGDATQPGQQPDTSGTDPRPPRA